MHQSLLEFANRIPADQQSEKLKSMLKRWSNKEPAEDDDALDVTLDVVVCEMLRWLSQPQKYTVAHDH